jgi:hypothetical protein
LDDLTARLRRLCQFAEAGGADEVWLRETARQLVTMLLAIPESRRAGLQRAAALQAAARAMRTRGYGPAEVIAALKGRTGLSRAQLYRLLNLGRENTDESHADETTAR